MGVSLLLTRGAWADAPQSQDEATLRQMVATQTEAWNRQDAAEWSKDFSPDADFVNIVGTVFQGRAEIEKRHAGIFASIFKGSRSKVTVRRLVFLGPDVAVVDTEHEVTGHSGLPPGVQNTEEPGVLRTRMKYVMKKSGGKWQITSGQNTDVKPPPKSPPPKK
ncbi:SgcJ/EcaC family oxidoreductase [Hyalangium sp. s54d21]|uniref:SgcJ/EcaC family oxidoreductase n=1 Tax=Hyalangium rubrum TaxID=3103134 RepID=A0ABU5HEN5_9BACT|nr:SgcJ/EcaC family oxidoreductase [Hyalangium sp. s54d21]MDY7231607.1 SgcJ/EcaC family oxidoreductase [Hyalangium sp. s54d21]